MIVNKTIWLLGSEGFLGSLTKNKWITANNRLVCFGRGFTQPPPNMHILGGFNEQITKETLNSAFGLFGIPDAIVSFAGGSSVGASLINPLKDFNDTVVSAFELFDWVKNTCPEVPIVMSSSAAVYGNSGQAYFSELDLPNPVSPYGHHKLVTELLAHEHACLYGMKIASLRLFSVYGPGLRKQLLWDACEKFSGTESPVFFGTGDEVRDWVYGEDVVEQIEKILLQPPTSGEHLILNIGTGNGHTTREVLTILSNQFGLNDQLSFNGVVREGDPFSLVSNNQFQLKRTQTTMNRNITYGIEKYANWYKSLRANKW